MDFLVEATNDQYVLAGRNSHVDTNIATASSVIGSILGTIESMNDGSHDNIRDLTFTVQGCGKVGSTVAKELVRLGAKSVQTCDLNSEAAAIDGCTVIEDWANTECDFLVPCANSLAITEDVALNFPKGIKYCVGATNRKVRVSIVLPRTYVMFDISLGDLATHLTFICLYLIALGSYMY